MREIGSHPLNADADPEGDTATFRFNTRSVETAAAIEEAR